MSHRILIVDDDAALAAMLAEFLRNEGFEVVSVGDGGAALSRLAAERFDLVILDIMLPDGNGLDLLRELRKANTRLPVMMLTARGEAIDRILGLELGADDYLPKPFDPREMLARVRAVLRRSIVTAAESPAREDSILHFGVLSLDPRRRRVTLGEHTLELTGAEFRVLRCLLEASGQAVDRHLLTEQALGRKLTLYDRAIDTHVSNLRRKIERLGRAGIEIRSVRGTGYEILETDHG